jgi:HAD superfamily hydrolase (TIGR01459 family)
MTTRIKGLNEIINNYDALLVDLWGCVHNGVQAYPQAIDALKNAKKKGAQICLLSNGPRRVSAILSRLDEMGVPREAYDHAVTSGEATWHALANPTDAWHQALGKKCYHLGPERDNSVREDARLEIVSRLEDADFIVNTGAYENADPLEMYEDTLQSAANMKLPMVCANPDLVVHVGDFLSICAGLIAERYTALGGNVAYHGKPFPSVYKMCFQLLEISNPARVLGIGDAIRTDVAGAKGVGADALFLAGGIYRENFGTDDPTPTAVKAAAAEEGNPMPDYLLPQLVW